MAEEKIPKNGMKSGSGKGTVRKRGRKGRRTKNMVKIAQERIEIIFDFAKEEQKKGKHNLLDRYVELARKIGMRYNVRIPSKYKWRYCKHCYAYMVPGKTCEQRTRNKFIIIHCKSCGKLMRRSIESLKKDRKKVEQ
jgi:ribonuclease P protein subunit RPR2